MGTNVTEKGLFSNVRGGQIAVPGVGVEPTRPFGREILSLLRLTSYATRALFREATAGIEPAVEDLQSPELPLFYVASAAFTRSRAF